MADAPAVSLLPRLRRPRALEHHDEIGPDGRKWGEATPTLLTPELEQQTGEDLELLKRKLAAARARSVGQGVTATFAGFFHIGADGSLHYELYPMDRTERTRFP